MFRKAQGLLHTITQDLGKALPQEWEELNATMQDIIAALEELERDAEACGDAAPAPQDVEAQPAAVDIFYDCPPETIEAIRRQSFRLLSYMTIAPIGFDPAKVESALRLLTVTARAEKS